MALDDDLDEELRRREAHAKNRESLFANEAFAIAMLQVVPGAAIVAALAQFGPLRDVMGQRWIAAFFTLMSLALCCAVVAGYYRYRSRAWDVKSTASEAKGDLHEAIAHDVLANAAVARMGQLMLASTALIVMALLSLVASLWLAA